MRSYYAFSVDILTRKLLLWSGCIFNWDIKSKELYFCLENLSFFVIYSHRDHSHQCPWSLLQSMLLVQEELHWDVQITNWNHQREHVEWHISNSPGIHLSKHLFCTPCFNKSRQHLSLFMSLCHLRSVLSVHGIVWHRILQQAQYKEHCTKWQFSSKELISFLNVIDIHHQFGCCIPALQHERTAPREAFGRSHRASSLTPDFEWHAARDAASADAASAAATQSRCKPGCSNSCLFLEGHCCRGGGGGV